MRRKYPRYFKPNWEELDDHGKILYRVQYRPDGRVYRIFDSGYKDISIWSSQQIEKFFKEILPAEVALL